MRKTAFVLLLFFLLSSGADAAAVIVDPGHGDPDGGSVGVTGVAEKDYNLALGKDLNSFFQILGIPSILTREDDFGIYDPSAETIREKKVGDLNKRLEIAEGEKDALFLSIHMNASPIASAAGLQVFYGRSEDSLELGTRLFEEFRAHVSETRVRALSRAPKKIFLMRRLSCPAVLLEYGYISNPRENALLLTAEY
ncbi:MAG: N-acetylmuramoyl-L-alanine amidase, partial [Clostridia bacterium]|nr:N-acetylmuramoyl-L-alanine amidase [Clostridia bacterium]